MERALEPIRKLARNIHVLLYSSGPIMSGKRHTFWEAEEGLTQLQRQLGLYGVFKTRLACVLSLWGKKEKEGKTKYEK